MRSSECLDGWSGGGCGVFIAPNHQNNRWGGCCRWAHRTLSGAPLTSALTSAVNCSAIRGTVQSTVAPKSRCSAGAPPVNYSRVALEKPEGEEFGGVLSGGTPDSPMRQTRALFGFFCSFLFEP
jgi:hypothetical protein